MYLPIDQLVSSCREIEIAIDLFPGASTVVRSPYRLAPSEMLELSNQLKELQEKGFIRPSHSLWGAPMLLSRRKTIFAQDIISESPKEDKPKTAFEPEYGHFELHSHAIWT
ncbi:hypothetical protein Tco_0158249 [Tanacetum coccineum]